MPPAADLVRAGKPGIGSELQQFAVTAGWGFTRPARDDCTKVRNLYRIGRVIHIGQFPYGGIGPGPERFQLHVLLSGAKVRPARVARKSFLTSISKSPS